jgi:hypothetical protein
MQKEDHHGQCSSTQNTNDSLVEQTIVTTDASLPSLWCGLHSLTVSPKSSRYPSGPKPFHVSSSSKVAIIFFLSKKRKNGLVSTTNVLRDRLPRRCLLSLHSVSHHAVHPTARHDIATRKHVKEKMCDIA